MNRKKYKIDTQIADAVISNIGIDNIISNSCGTWLWGNGYWQKANERRLKQIISTFTAEKVLTKSKCNSVLDLIQTKTFIEKDPLNPSDLILNCSNGELHFLENKWQLKTHKKENFFTFQIPVKYDPNANCEHFNEFLTGICSEKDEKSNDLSELILKKNCILEMIGLTLLRTCKYEKFVLLYGNGANGKSVLLGLIQALCGEQNVCSILPSNFTNNFHRAQLQSKLANLVTEMAIDERLPDGELKSIVSGELMTAENKYQSPFQFRPFSTCWFATNHLPHLKDFSKGIYRRAIIIHLANVFDGSRCDLHLLDKLKEEVSGILNLILESLGQVLTKEKVIEPESCKRIKIEWQQTADPVTFFVDSSCVKGSTHRSAFAELYAAFLDWLQMNNLPNLSEIAFSKRLKELGFEKSRSSYQRFIDGLKLHD